MSAVFLLRRLILAVPTLFGVTVIVFVLLRVVPGDPINMMIGPGATPQDIQALREIYGLDKSIYDQFVIYLRDLAHGHFGTSISLRQDVLLLILGRLPVTIELCVVAMLGAVAAGVGLGVAGAYGQGRWPEAAVDGFSGLVLAIPDFLWALLFILLLGVAIPIMPISGRLDFNTEFRPLTEFYLVESLMRGELSIFASVLLHMVLPAAALALPLTAIIARVLKSSINEVMTQDYIMMARAKGYDRRRIVVREALRNALIPTVTLTGVQFTFLVGGTVLIERIFAYPGLGNMAVDAVINRDLPLIQGIVLTFAVMFLAINLLVDLTYAILNPRLRDA
jgi:ABC-type dipeptide/oligopeptide/nickel transport system permease component